MVWAYKKLPDLAPHLEKEWSSEASSADFKEAICKAIC